MKKALRTNIILIWVFVIMLTGISFSEGVGSGIAALKATVSAGVLDTIIYFIPFNEKIKGTIIVSIPAIAALILSASKGGEPRMINLYFISLMMQALYFDRKLMVGYGSGLILTLSIVCFVKPAFLVGVGGGMIEIISPLGMLICSFVVLALLTTWGQDNVEKAQEGGVEARLH